MSDKLERLRTITRALLDATQPAYSLRSEVVDLKLLLEQSGDMRISDDVDISAGETRTESGIAISPQMAAMCVDDFARTVQFIRGLNASVTDLTRVRDDRPLRILYAGCGPLAPLALPLMSIYPASEVRFTLLDIHPASIASVRAMIDELDLRDHVEDLITAEATSFKIDPEKRPDVVVVEMLRAGLEAEPQVAVATHLMKQVPKAVMVPEEISLELTLVNASREFDFDHTGSREVPERDRIELGTVFRFDRSSLHDPFPEATVRLPEFDPQRYSLKLRTTIRVYGAHVLQDYDSGITLPKNIDSSGTQFRPGDTLRFCYQFGNHPRLNVECVRD